MSHEAFQKAICQEPDDDTHRLVYADWLDDHGDAIYAEFIRVQCELETLTPASDRFVDLEERERELRILVGQRSPIPAPELNEIDLDVDYLSWDGFKRGFHHALLLDEHSSGERQAQKMCEKLMSSLPDSTIQYFTFTDFDPHPLQTVIESGLLSFARGLSLYSDLYSDEADFEEGYEEKIVELLLRSQDVVKLKYLGLFSPFGNPALKVLLQSSSLQDLESLSLEIYQPTVNDVTAFTSASLSQQLSSLQLWGTFNTDHIVALTNESWPRLHSLHLNNAELGVSAITALAQSQVFPSLASLDLQGAQVGSVCVRALNDLDDKGIRSLDLSNRKIGSKDIVQLAQSPVLSSLQTLHLRNSSFGVQGATGLSKSRHLQNLRRLDLSYHEQAGKRLQGLTRGEAFANLTTLNLEVPGTSSICSMKEAADFIRGLEVPSIRHLNLSGIPIGAHGAKALAKKSWIKSIRILEFNWCRIPDSGAEALLEALDPSKVVYLSLYENKLSQEMQNRVAEINTNQT